MVNAPEKQLYLNGYTSKKIFILNLWGTWCSPCIAEMDSLAKLQDKFEQQIQVIGVSNDSEKKLKGYIAKKPSKIWLVSDSSFALYYMLRVASVGYCAIIDEQRKIIAVVNTDSVNNKLITRVLSGEKIKSDAKILTEQSTDKDPFGVDTLQYSSFTIRSYMKDQQTRSKAPENGPFAFRRRSFYNVTLSTLYMDAYEITSPEQIIYNIDKKKYDDFDDTNQLFCFDLLVKPQEKDSLQYIMQKKLNESMPVKARIELRVMPVYLLKRKSGVALNMPVSASSEFSYEFSGNGFEGKGVTMDDFSRIYLTNELQIPVINESGLTSRYDIKTTNELRDNQNVFKAVNKLGLTFEKAERPVKVMILYK